MKIKKFNGFNEKGHLHYGMYNLSLNEFKKIFSENKTEQRRKIMKEYEKHLTELKNTGYYIDHWIGGSFISKKENPNDIDILTEFDGLKAEKHDENEKIKELIRNSKSKTNNLCHSLGVYRYPPDEKEKYDYYLKTKIRIIVELFGHDVEGNNKGVVHLIGDES